MRHQNYEVFARTHRRSFPVYLVGETEPFWSKGWQGCSSGCGHDVVDNVALRPFRRVSEGEVTVGFTCNLKAV